MAINDVNALIDRLRPSINQHVANICTKQKQHTTNLQTNKNANAILLGIVKIGRSSGCDVFKPTDPLVGKHSSCPTMFCSTYDLLTDVEEHTIRPFSIIVRRASFQVFELLYCQLVALQISPGRPQPMGAL